MSTRSDPRWLRILPWMLGILAISAHAAGVLNGFTFDDPLIITHNPVVMGDGGLLPILTSRYWVTEFTSVPLYRPVTTLSYWLQVRLTGPDPFGFHLINILLHAGVTLAVYVLCRRLGGLSVACAASILFATHPIHTEAVASVVGRAELLAALLVVGAWILRERPVVASAVFGLAMLSKESAIVLPALLAVEDLTRGVTIRWRRYAPFIAVIALVMAIRLAILGPVLGDPGGPLAGAPIGERAMTALAVLGREIVLLLAPLRLSADYSYNQIPLVTSPVDFWFLIGGGLSMACAALCYVTWKRNPPVACGVLLFGVGVAPTSNVLFSTGVIMAERLLYLPSVGFCLAAGAGIAWLSRRLAQRLVRPTAPMADVKAIAAVAGMLALIPAVPYTLRSVTRTRDWRDQVTLFEATTRTSPRSALAHLNLGSAYQSLGRLAEAEDAYRRVIAIAPDRPGPYFNLGTLLEATGRGEEAIAAYREAVRVDPGNTMAMNNLGRALLAAGRVSEAIPILREAVVASGGGRLPSVNLAAALLADGRHAEAEAIAARVLDRHPNDADARRVLERSRRDRDGSAR